MRSSPFDVDAARSIPPTIRFGTSTWTYPGWKGLIYHSDYKSEKEFKAKSLAEYSQIPLFRSVGIDSTFYNPPSKEMLENYASQVPSDFKWISKVWERITVAEFPKHSRYGKQSGTRNSDFLNPDIFTNEVLPAYQASEPRAHTGPFVFQFPYMKKDLVAEISFLTKLHRFLSSLPKDFQYATEIRNSNFLNKDYFALLNETGATHCFNHWSYMPKLRDQMKSAAEAGGLEATFFIARILTPRGINYQEAVKRFQPYNQLKEPNQEMREDVVRLVQRALKRKINAFIIVNNRCEGNAPMTIDAIGRMIIASTNQNDQ